MEQIRLAFRQQPDRLFPVNGLLQDHFVDLELAGFLVRLRLFAHVSRAALEHPLGAQGTLAHRLLAGEINLGLRFRGLSGFANLLAGLRLAGLELKLHVTILGDQEGLERPALLGDELLQQIGLAGLQQLQHLLALDGPLQDDLARSKSAGAVGPGSLLAHVVHRGVEDARAAFRALA